MPPSADAPTRPRRALVVLALAAILGLGLGAPAAAQVPTTSTPGVLVPGSTPPTTTPATTTTPPAQSGGGFLDLELDANEKVWIIVGGLVAVALLLLVLTVVYWRHTKPGRSPVAEDGVDGRSARREQKRRRKAKAKDPFTDAGGSPEPTRDPVTGPLDLDELLGAPDPARSVFGGSDEPRDSSR